MKKVSVISKKYDGSLRDEYETYLYEETDETITLFSLPGLKYWDYRKAGWFEAEDGLIEIYFKHKWYNILHICEQNRHIDHRIYVNIAMPVTFHVTGIEWIDLDLDYRVYLDNSVKRLDQDEFEQNVQKMRYPPDLIEQAYHACREVEAGLRSGAYPFDYQRQVELYHQIKASNT